MAALAAKRCFLLDALNIAYWCGPPPSLRLPLALAAQLLRDGHEALMIFDASTRHRLSLADRGFYEDVLLLPSVAIETPSGRSADGLLLKQARTTGAIIISRDHFADQRRRYRKLIDDPQRLLDGWIREGQIGITALDFSIRLPATTEEAWRELRGVHLAPRG